MSDFLGNLLAKNFSPTAAVQPRLSSLFESAVNDSGGAATDFVQPPDRTASPEHIDTSAMQSTRDAAITPPRHHPEESPTRDTINSSGQKTFASSSMPEAEKISVPDSGEIISSRGAASNPADSKKNNFSKPAPKNNQDIDRELPDSIGAIQPTAQHVAHVQPAAEAQKNISRDSENRTSASIEEKIISSTLQNISADVRAVIVPRINPIVRERQAANNPVVKNIVNQSEPTIHVSIGRIDVRAVMQAAPEKPRAKASHGLPPVSLTDYLKHKSEGNR